MLFKYLYFVQKLPAHTNEWPFLVVLEHHLSQLESPNFSTWKLQGELTIEEVKQWARKALEMLKGICADVCSHPPELHFADLSLEMFVKSHLPDIPDMANLTEMCPCLPDMEGMHCHSPTWRMSVLSYQTWQCWSCLPEMPQLPGMDDVLTDMCLKLDDVCSCFHVLNLQ